MTIRIEDHGVLAAWRAASADEVRTYAPAFEGGSIGLVEAEGQQHLLIWVGSVCDTAGTLRAGPGWLELIPDPRPGCDAMGVGRALVLTFEQGVAPMETDVALRTYLLESVEPAADGWGPLAVLPPQDGTDTAAIGGTLQISSSCVYLEQDNGLKVLLVWHADRVRWHEETETIEFTNFPWVDDGRTVILRDVDRVLLGGGHGDELSRGIEWVAAPSPSCAVTAWFSVGAAEPAG